MAYLEQISPIVPVSSLERSKNFFRDYLGFAVRFESEGYAYLVRDKVSIRLVPAGNSKDLRDPNSQQHCYIDVSQIDQLYAELSPKLQTLPAGRFRPIFDTAYGQREFHVIDPDALLISFGERIDREVAGSAQ